MQNKPNWPPGRDTPAFHHSIIPPFQARCRLYKQSQTWAPWDIWGTRRGRPSKCAKQSQFFDCGLGDRPAASSLIRPIAPNKPNCRVTAVPAYSWAEPAPSAALRAGSEQSRSDAHATERPTASLRTGLLRQTRRLRQKSPSRVSTRVSGPISRIGSVEADFCRARQTNPISGRWRNGASACGGRSYGRFVPQRTSKNKANKAVVG
jgi:hypothetical protein